MDPSDIYQDVVDITVAVQYLPVIPDTPRRDAGLGFQDYGDIVADAILGVEPPQFTVGLYGRWGSGKSSLLLTIERILNARQEDVITVRFDAWRFERSEHIALPLLHKIRAYLDTEEHGDLREKVEHALLALAKGLSFSVAGINLAWSEDGSQDKGDPLDQMDLAYEAPFRAIEEIGDAMGETRIVVLIDDLDRCSPERVVDVIESINLILDVPGIIYVLALDYDVLVQAIEERYGHLGASTGSRIDGHQFIEKIIQLPFRVPPMDVGSLDFLPELVPRWAEYSDTFPIDIKETIASISGTALQSNPRQTKRLINSFLLTQRLLEVRELEIQDRFLLSLLGLELGWPAEYQKVKKAILRGDPTVFKDFRESDQTDLATYVQRFFKKLPRIERLQAVVRLAETMSTEASSQSHVDEDKFHDSEVEDLHSKEEVLPRKVRKKRYPQVRGELQNLGFQRHNKNKDLRHPLLPDYRIILTSNRLHIRRLKGGSDDCWVLEEGFPLPQAGGRAVQMVRRILERREIDPMLASPTSSQSSNGGELPGKSQSSAR